MRQSQLFHKTLRDAPKDADNISTVLLTRGGFIYKLMAGSYIFQYLGWRVHQKIEAVIRKEMNGIGGQEIAMPALQPKELWQKSGRWSKLAGDMYQFKDPSEREVGLAMTHEEPMIDLLSQQPLSYQDFPIAVYQFQVKFRYEPRAKSGLLRLREFIMKDLYSNHASEQDLNDYYEIVKAAYGRIFAKLEIPAVPTLASGGIFTPDFSHEFQSVSEIGEDTVYVCPENDYAVNKEVVEKAGLICPNHQTELVEHRAVEVGNIFKLGTTFSKEMNVQFTDADGQLKPFWSGCYGIGIARSMGVIVEQHHDEQGIIWPKAVAPFAIHLLDLTKTDEEKRAADELYQQLTGQGAEVLYDDRSVTPGTKFSDADLIGIPTRVIISAKTLEKQSVEVKERAAQQSQLVSLTDFVSSVTVDK